MYPEGGVERSEGAGDVDTEGMGSWAATAGTLTSWTGITSSLGLEAGGGSPFCVRSPELGPSPLPITPNLRLNFRIAFMGLKRFFGAGSPGWSGGGEDDWDITAKSS